MLTTTGHLLSLIRFSHTLFALPFALLAAVMAWRLRAVEQLGGINAFMLGDSGFQDLSLTIAGYTFNMDWLIATRFLIGWQELLGILLCMITARSAAMAFNRLVDRKYDAENPRTAGRHLPAGILSVSQVTAFTAACVIAFTASTVLFFPNRLPLYLSVPVLLLLMGYSYSKRFTSLSHFWLGAALAASPVAVWIAIRGDAVLENVGDLLPAIVLGGAVFAWVAGFDMIYACQDYEFDRQSKLHSIPKKLGIPGSLRLAAACHLVTVLLLALLGVVYPPFGLIYWVAVAAVALLLLYEHALVRPDDLERVNTAFFNVNAVISMGLLVLGTLDLWLGGG